MYYELEQNYLEKIITSILHFGGCSELAAEQEDWTTWVCSLGNDV